MLRGVQGEQDRITIKGIRDGLLVALGGGNWEANVRTLESRLASNPAFFRGGRLALDVGSHALDRSDLEGVRRLLARHQVDLWAVVSTSAVTEAAAQSLGLVIDLGPSSPREPVEAEDGGGDSGVEGILVQRTLRSGQVLRHPGHIVVIGDVNPGAEIVAGKNIVVWGRARGMVHAGALGDEGAVVCALDLSPTQLRIAGHIARSPEEKRQDPMPEMALMRDDQIVAIPWPGGQ
jgi:septum site-determining protein MinC